MPIHLMIEPSTFCNLHCALCLVSIGLKRPTGNLDMDISKKVIEEIGDYIFTLLLWDWGEPFMTPRIYDMISLIKKYYIKTISSTNGHIFEDADKADSLIRSGLDTIIFAIDGIHRDLFVADRYGHPMSNEHFLHPYLFRMIQTAKAQIFEVFTDDTFLGGDMTSTY